jgi:hypothetical protein
MQKRHHVGMIVKSARRERVAELLAEYVERVKYDFATVAPPRARPSD